jgi:hypothetical protein
MPVTSTGEASEHMAWNPFSQATGIDKVTGKEVGIWPMPEGETLVPLRQMVLEDLHASLHHMITRLEKLAYYADPNEKYVPLQLDPQVEYVVRHDGRWHFAIWLQTAGTINVVFPGMQATAITAAVGWNVLPCPEGTKIFAGSGRMPCFVRYANRGIAA